MKFQCADAISFRADMRFDALDSLETIEHVDCPSTLFANLVNNIAPGGRLIASVPVTPSVDANPHHRNNFTAASFRKMAEVHSLKEIDSLKQVQPYNPVSIIMRREVRAANIRRSLGLFYARHPSHLVFAALVNPDGWLR